MILIFHFNHFVFFLQIICYIQKQLLATVFITDKVASDIFLTALK